MKSEQLNKIPVILFSIGVLLNCLFFTKVVLDNTLVPRFVFLAFFLFVFTIVAFFSFKIFHISIDAFSLFYLLFIVLIVASISWSLNTSVSIVESTKTLLYFFVFIFTSRLLSDYGDYFLTTILKAILILFFISLIQIFFQLLDLSSISRNDLYSISGISGHKNLYSSFLFLCSVFSFFSFFYFKKHWKYISLVAIVFQFILIALLQTRAVWLGYAVFVISSCVLFSLHKIFKSITKKRTISYIIIAIVIINTFFVFVLPQILNRYNELKPVTNNAEQITDLTSMSERVLVWQKTYDIFKEHPWLGVGANNWQIYFSKTSLPDIYAVQDLNVTFQRPHNDFLWILSEYGIVGFNLFLIFIISILFFLYYKLINQYNIIYVVLIAGIIGFLCISFFDFPKERIEHSILYAVLLSISVYMIKKDINPIVGKTFNLSKLILIPLLLLFASLFYVSFLNFRGEYFTQKMYIERIRKNNFQVINMCNSAVSFCYTIDPTSVPIYWYKGNANANLGKFPEALNDFKNAYHDHPYNPYVLNDLGSSYFMSNTIDSAKLFYKEAARINPRFDEPKLNLTAIYINENNYEEAKKWNESIFHDSKRRDYYTSIINGGK
jgi:O-antigen ligase